VTDDITSAMWLGLTRARCRREVILTQYGWPVMCVFDFGHTSGVGRLSLTRSLDGRASEGRYGGGGNKLLDVGRTGDPTSSLSTGLHLRCTMYDCWGAAGRANRRARGERASDARFGRWSGWLARARRSCWRDLSSFMKLMGSQGQALGWLATSHMRRAIQGTDGYLPG
jgi:hypothetical protein